MTNYPKISIITPSFNQGQYIEQTILSVLEQNYPNLEYIIIDGGSTDNSVEIIKKYEKHLKYWISEKDKGQSHAINKGLEKSTGEIFNWINSDDYLEPNSLFTVAHYFKKHPKLQLLCGYTNIFDDTGLAQTFKFRTHIYNSLEKTIVEEKLNQQGMFYKINAIKVLKGVNITLNYVMDLELWFRFMAKYGISSSMMIEETLGNFRYHSNSKTAEFEQNFRKEVQQVFYYMAIQLKLPKPIIEAYFTSENNYKPTNWTFNKINANQLLEEISNRYLFDFYKQNKLEAAKIAYFNQLKQGKIHLNKAYLSLFYRLFISHKKYGEK